MRSIWGCKLSLLDCLLYENTDRINIMMQKGHVDSIYMALFLSLQRDATSPVHTKLRYLSWHISGTESVKKYLSWYYLCSQSSTVVGDGIDIGVVGVVMCGGGCVYSGVIVSVVAEGGWFNWICGENGVVLC